jgi:predicted transcriptional regulator
MIEKVYYQCAHPVRMSILKALIDKDMYVQELATALAIARALVSYHIGQLGKAGVIMCKYVTVDGHTRRMCALTERGVEIYRRLAR